MIGLKWKGFTVLLAAVLALSACGKAEQEPDKKPHHESSQSQKDNHSTMKHEDSGEIPAGLKKAERPTYAAGSQVKIKTGHMPGMKGATATIVGAYDTMAYAVSYDPTTGGARVKNHKWIIQEELRDAGDKEQKPGDRVTLEADHMEGMKGAKAIIDSAKQTTVYMIDYKPTDGGKEVKNHKWVTDDELSPVQ